MGGLMSLQNNLLAQAAWRSTKNAGIVGAKATRRLSSGYKINSAADDAAGLAISEKMRAQIRGLEKAERNIQDGICLIQTADGALGEMSNMVQRMNELCVQATNDTNTTEDRKKIEAEIHHITSQINQVASSLEFNKKTLLDGKWADSYDWNYGVYRPNAQTVRETELVEMIKWANGETPAEINAVGDFEPFSAIAGTSASESYSIITKTPEEIYAQDLKDPNYTFPTTGDFTITIREGERKIAATMDFENGVFNVDATLEPHGQNLKYSVAFPRGLDGVSPEMNAEDFEKYFKVALEGVDIGDISGFANDGSGRTQVSSSYYLEQYNALPVTTQYDDQKVSDLAQREVDLKVLSDKRDAAISINSPDSLAMVAGFDTQIATAINDIAQLNTDVANTKIATFNIDESGHIQITASRPVGEDSLINVSGTAYDSIVGSERSNTAGTSGIVIDTDITGGTIQVYSLKPNYTYTNGVFSGQFDRDGGVIEVNLSSDLSVWEQSIPGLGAAYRDRDGTWYIVRTDGATNAVNGTNAAGSPVSGSLYYGIEIEGAATGIATQALTVNEAGVPYPYRQHPYYPATPTLTTASISTNDAAIFDQGTLTYSVTYPGGTNTFTIDFAKLPKDLDFENDPENLRAYIEGRLNDSICENGKPKTTERNIPNPPREVSPLTPETNNEIAYVRLVDGKLYIDLVEERSVLTVTEVGTVREDGSALPMYHSSSLERGKSYTNYARIYDDNGDEIARVEISTGKDELSAYYDNAREFVDRNSAAFKDAGWILSCDGERLHLQSIAKGENVTVSRFDLYANGSFSTSHGLATSDEDVKGSNANDTRMKDGKLEGLYSYKDWEVIENFYDIPNPTRGIWLQTGANSGQGMTIHIPTLNSQALGLTIDSNAYPNWGISAIDKFDRNGFAEYFSNIGVISKNDALALYDKGISNYTSSDTVEGLGSTTHGLDVSSSWLTGTMGIKITQNALNIISTERAKLGAQQNRLEYVANSVVISSENLSASESHISDADMAKETMNKAKSMVLEHASMAMLAQANQAPKGVLQLLT